MKVKRYSGKEYNQWNDFIKEARNATFLFCRKYMDYHSDRFDDFSLMVYDKNDNLIACFPANVTTENILYSHQGLTYGGFCFKNDLKLLVQIEVIQNILLFYHENGVNKIIYKAFPRFYNDLQTDEIEYALFLLKAELIRRDTAIAIDSHHRIKYNSNYRREANQAIKNEVIITESEDLEGFWKEILEPNLLSRYNVKPVHSLEEIKLLRSNFPNNIKLFVAKQKGKILAGTVIYETKIVAHAQYISATEEARKNGALNLLFIELLDNIYKSKRFFDFGIANENNGRQINKGLLSWKERFGGRTYSHDFYEIEPENYNLLN